MTIRWHKLGLKCPNCSGLFTVLNICCAADGAVMVEGLCVHCGDCLSYETTIAKLVSFATELDTLEEKEIPLSIEDLMEKFPPRGGVQ